MYVCVSEGVVCARQVGRSNALIRLADHQEIEKEKISVPKICKRKMLSQGRKLAKCF